MQQTQLPSMEIPQGLAMVKRARKPSMRSAGIWSLKPAQLMLPVFSSVGVDEESGEAEQSFDLSDYLERDRHDFVYEAFERCLPSGIDYGDVLILNGRMQAHRGDLVLVQSEDDISLKRLEYEEGRPWLWVDDPEPVGMPIEDGQSFQILGVVTRVIHALK